MSGEGGSGGALAIGLGDHLIMLQYSIYSVISPEGCASILWKNAENAEQAAAAMGITAQALQKLGLVDEVIAEPLGGAHRNADAMSQVLENAIVANLTRFETMPVTELLARRQQRVESVGRFRDS